jgi:hypothetical protein
MNDHSSNEPFGLLPWVTLLALLVGLLVAAQSQFLVDYYLVP